MCGLLTLPPPRARPHLNTTVKLCVTVGLTVFVRFFFVFFLSLSFSFCFVYRVRRTVSILSRRVYRVFLFFLPSFLVGALTR